MAFPPALPRKHDTLRGPGYSNIVIPGFLLHGPLPEGAAQLEPLVREGVTTFVCVQGELSTTGTRPAALREAGHVVMVRPYLAHAQAVADAVWPPTEAHNQARL